MPQTARVQGHAHPATEEGMRTPTRSVEPGDMATVTPRTLHSTWSPS